MRGALPACLVLALPWLLIAAAIGAAAKEHVVATEEALVAALANNTVSRIVITQDITLTAAEWDKYPRPMQLNRSVSIVGTSLDVMLDMAWLKRRLSLVPSPALPAPRVWLEFRNISITRVRTPGALTMAGLDLVDVSPGSFQRFTDLLLVADACVPMPFFVREAPRLERPASIPNAYGNLTQYADVWPQGYCLPGSYPPAPPLDSSPSPALSAAATDADADAEPRCWPEAGWMQDMGLVSLVTGRAGSRVSNGVALYDNCTFVCRTTIPMKCYTQSGMDPACFQSMLVEWGLVTATTYDLFDERVPAGPVPLPLPPSPSPPPLAVVGTPSPRPQLEIILPAVIGGSLALLGGAAVAAMIWGRRRSSGGPGGRGGSGGMSAKCGVPLGAVREASSSSEAAAPQAGGLLPLPPTLFHPKSGSGALVNTRGSTGSTLGGGTDSRSIESATGLSPLPSTSPTQAPHRILALGACPTSPAHLRLEPPRQHSPSPTSGTPLGSSEGQAVRSSGGRGGRPVSSLLGNTPSFAARRSGAASFVGTGGTAGGSIGSSSWWQQPSSNACNACSAGGGGSGAEAGMPWAVLGGVAAAWPGSSSLPAASASEAVEAVITSTTPVDQNINMAMVLGRDVVLIDGAVIGTGAFGTVVEGVMAPPATRAAGTVAAGVSGPGSPLPPAVGGGGGSEGDAGGGGGGEHGSSSGGGAFRRVAVKVLRGLAASISGKEAAALRKEVEVLSRCRHTNIVRLLGGNLTPPDMFLVEELMEISLDKLIHGGDPPLELSLEQVLRIGREVALGLAYLHPTVMHRDLKPANVLLDEQGTAKLSDFGLARLTAATLHNTSPEVGSVPYMAPECFGTGSHEVTHRSDLFGLGVLLWEMIARERPWTRQHFMKVALAVSIRGERLPLAAIRDRAPRKLVKLVEECWHEDPYHRPSALDAAKRLTLMLQQLQQGTLQPPEPETEPESQPQTAVHAGPAGVGAGVGAAEGAGPSPFKTWAQLSSAQGVDQLLSGTGTGSAVGGGGWPEQAARDGEPRGRQPQQQQHEGAVCSPREVLSHLPPQQQCQPQPPVRGYSPGIVAGGSRLHRTSSAHVRGLPPRHGNDNSNSSNGTASSAVDLLQMEAVAVAAAAAGPVAPRSADTYTDTAASTRTSPGVRIISGALGGGGSSGAHMLRMASLMRQQQQQQLQQQTNNSLSPWGPAGRVAGAAAGASTSPALPAAALLCSVAGSSGSFEQMEGEYGEAEEAVGGAK